MKSDSLPRTTSWAMTKMFVFFFLFANLEVNLVKAKGPADYLRHNDEWFCSAAAVTVRDNILSYQTPLGGWPKNIDTCRSPFSGDVSELRGTFDNGATTDELRFLAKRAAAANDKKSAAAFDRGLQFILNSQYPHGGWPQYFPPGNGYARYITFNDDAMVRLLVFLREVKTSPIYSFVADTKRESLGRVFSKGIECILRCQVRETGVLTVWCAQHDEVDFSPRPARVYELVSLSGSESVGIVRLLMSIDSPSPELIDSIESAVRWFKKVKIEGIRVEIVDSVDSPSGKDKLVVTDANAPPIWARFYSLGTYKPIFSDQRGLAFERLSEISQERRMGYSWYTDRPKQLIEKDYPAWRRKLKSSND